MTNREYGPLSASHPIITDKQTCPYCENQFQTGDVVTLRPLPPDDEEERRKAELGRVYTAPALLMHSACSRALDKHASDAADGSGYM